ncbi:hypothetical protein BC332_34360 [Capsicum chinense]|nr:hypothetical protein BC332_34360 [Capsicum chinense]
MLGSENSLWCDLFIERWGSDQATFYAPDDSKSWKHVYMVQDRCDRNGLDKAVYTLPSPDHTFVGLHWGIEDYWIRMMNDMHEVALLENSEERFCLECIMKCLKVFARLVAGEKVSSSQGWATVFGYVGYVLVGDVAAEIFNFCRAMVCSGCCFRAVADIYDEVMAHFQREAGSVADFKKEAFSIQNLRDLYLSILKTILQELTEESREHRCLHYYLSSLSKLAGDLDNLQSVRQAVWERLEEFSENFRLPNHVRVYILELMQLIAASDKNSKGFSLKLKVEVHSWEGWENTHNATANCENAAADGISNKVDASNKFTNTLIALKSTQLVSTISPSIEITPEDLSTVESTVSCFLGVSKFAERALIHLLYFSDFKGSNSKIS